jgi:hypothetical protein
VFHTTFRLLQTDLKNYVPFLRCLFQLQYNYVNPCAPDSNRKNMNIYVSMLMLSQNMYFSFNVLSLMAEIS